MDKVIDHGLIHEPIVPDDHYVLRGYGDEKVGGVALMKDGHGWRNYKPNKELQNRYGFESMNCAAFGTLNCLETLAAFFGFLDFPKDCSDRYVGVLAGTTPTGNSPHKVIEVIRQESGVIPEGVLPWTDDINSWPEYYSPNPMDENLVALGQTILRKYKIGHKWVFNGPEKNRQGKLIEALSTGTVAVSVLAWRSKNGRYWKNEGEIDNHWVQLLDYKQGEYWLIYDHYDEVEKKLDWGYAFNMSKVYFLERSVNPNWKPFSDNPWGFSAFFGGIVNLIKSLWQRPS